MLRHGQKLGSGFTRVERGVQYVRERFFEGRCREVAGLRIHGTTLRHPLGVFQDEERQALAPWDGELYSVTSRRTAQVHSDHHVACQYAVYSVPDLCLPGQQVEIDLGAELVSIYHRGRLDKLHPCQPRGGEVSPQVIMLPTYHYNMAYSLGKPGDNLNGLVRGR